jgi:hypothetical protein
MADKENAVQQAQQWAQEARTQRATVLSILRFFGLPERDYEALTLIQEKDSQMREAMLKARDALHAAAAGLEWYRDRCPDAVDGSDSEADEQIGEALAALEAELRPSGVMEVDHG